MVGLNALTDSKNPDIVLTQTSGEKLLRIDLRTANSSQPLFRKNSDQARRRVKSSSFGEDCIAGFPGSCGTSLSVSYVARATPISPMWSSVIRGDAIGSNRGQNPASQNRASSGRGTRLTSEIWWFSKACGPFPLAPLWAFPGIRLNSWARQFLFGTRPFEPLGFLVAVLSLPITRPPHSPSGKRLSSSLLDSNPSYSDLCK